VTRFPKPTYRNPLPPKPDPGDFKNDLAGFIVATWEATDARPPTVGRTKQVTGWAIRKAFPNMRRMMARLAIDADIEWFNYWKERT